MKIGFYLQWIEIAAIPTTLNRILGIIAEEIRHAGETIASDESDVGLDFAEARFEEECEAVEELQGLAFAAVQTHLNRVRKRVADTSKACERAFGKPFSFDVLEIGVKLEGTSMTAVEAMNVAANYWKHHMECTARWPATRLAKSLGLCYVDSLPLVAASFRGGSGCPLAASHRRGDCSSPHCSSSALPADNRRAWISQDRPRSATSPSSPVPRGRWA